MTTRRQFFRFLGVGAMISVAPEALTEAVAAIAPQVVADPLGDWLPLNGEIIPVEELPELAQVAAGWVKEGKVHLPLMQATTRETWHRAVPAAHSHGITTYADYSHGMVAEAYTVEKALPARYMVKARGLNGLPLGTIMLFAA